MRYGEPSPAQAEIHMGLLESLGSVVVNGADLAAWSGFATDLLGMQIAERSSAGLALRMDERRQRLMLNTGRARTRYIFGWEVADSASMEAVAVRVEAAKVAVTREPGSVAAQRGVSSLISFPDPLGNTVEVFCGAAAAHTMFEPGRTLSGFRTGSLGLGHAVLTVESIETAAMFYQDVLGFRLSDYTLAPFRAFFFHINPRHHSLAFIETGGNGLHHLMVELKSLDDVGQGYDLAQGERDRIGVTLGRHSNDFMTSFYAQSPSPFMVEYGWGGRDIDPATWVAREYTCGPSLWGHDRSWLTPEKRMEARAMRLKAAAAGIREPVQVLEGHYVKVR
jgi:2,3-dihydroxybiphenyl 1,2-dioxygenase